MTENRGGTVGEEERWVNWSTNCEVVIKKIEEVQLEKKRAGLTCPSTAFFFQVTRKIILRIVLLLIPGVLLC